MKKHSGGLYVKAAGGIRNIEDARRMLDAGADRLGCSSGVAIVAAESPLPMSTSIENKGNY
jgi:deoxyribose-phosphate aldolase